MKNKLPADSLKKRFQICTKKSVWLTAIASIGLTAISMAQNVPSYVPSNGLVGWWPFNGNANDESGNGNNGTVNGATLTSDRFGINNSAYLFTNNGIIQNITTNYSGILGQNNRSISLWFLQDDVISIQDQQVLCGYGGSSEASMFAPTTYGGRIGMDVLTIARHYSEFNVGKWNHAIFIYENGNSISGVKIYLNGVLQTISYSEFGNQNTILNTTSGLKFRINGSILSQLFIGKIDDIGIWNRALTDQEIKNLYNGNICYQNITVTDTLLINTGINSFNPVKYDNTIKVYPNPAKTHITIDYGNYTSMNGYQLKIINSLGQQVFQTSIKQQSNYLDLSTWGGNGLYLVHIIDPQGNIIDVKKIVLQ